MAETTIEWTTRRTADGRLVPGYSFNPWIGCEKVSPACDHCYAERDAANRLALVAWGNQAAGGTRRVTVDSTWLKPERWARQAHEAGTRPLVFVASWADVFEKWGGPMLDAKNRVIRKGVAGWYGAEPHGETPDGSAPAPVTMDEVRARLFRLMARTAYALDWLVLTKRPGRMARGWAAMTDTYRAELLGLAARDARYGPAADFFGRHGMIPNVWPGTTAENQEWWDKRIPELRSVPGVRRFVSVEPQTGPIAAMTESGGMWVNDLADPDPACPIGGGPGSPGIHWVICGGESGVHARPANPEWYRSLRDQCERAGTPFFFKQHGEVVDEENMPAGLVASDRIELPLAGGVPTTAHPAGRAEVLYGRRVGRTLAGRHLDGRTWDQIPASMLSS